MAILIAIWVVLGLSGAGAGIAVMNGRKALSVALVVIACIAVMGLMFLTSARENCAEEVVRTRWCG